MNTIENDFKMQLATDLEAGPVIVTFIKKDGSHRVMTCTTSLDLIPAIVPVTKPHSWTVFNFPVSKPEKVANSEIAVVYDIVARAWRSFRWASVQSIEIHATV